MWPLAIPILSVDIDDHGLLELSITWPRSTAVWNTLLSCGEDRFTWSSDSSAFRSHLPVLRGHIPFPLRLPPSHWLFQGWRLASLGRWPFLLKLASEVQTLTHPLLIHKAPIRVRMCISRMFAMYVCGYICICICMVSMNVWCVWYVWDVWYVW